MSTCLLFIYYEYIYICLHLVRGILYHFNADAKSHVHVQLFFRWETQICLLSSGQPSKLIKKCKNKWILNNPKLQTFEVQGSRSQQSWWISRPCKALRKALGPRSPDVEPAVFALEWISKDLEPAEKAKVKAPPWSSDYQWIWEYVGLGELGTTLKICDCRKVHVPKCWYIAISCDILNETKHALFKAPQMSMSCTQIPENCERSNRN